jgi:hypothetical protein
MQLCFHILNSLSSGFPIDDLNILCWRVMCWPAHICVRQGHITCPFRKSCLGLLFLSDRSVIVYILVQKVHCKASFLHTQNKYIFYRFFFFFILLFGFQVIVLWPERVETYFGVNKTHYLPFQKVSVSNVSINKNCLYYNSIIVKTVLVNWLTIIKDPSLRGLRGNQDRQKFDFWQPQAVKMFVGH